MTDACCSQQFSANSAKRGVVVIDKKVLKDIQRHLCSVSGTFERWQQLSRRLPQQQRPRQHLQLSSGGNSWHSSSFLELRSSCLTSLLPAATTAAAAAAAEVDKPEIMSSPRPPTIWPTSQQRSEEAAPVGASPSSSF